MNTDEKLAFLEETLCCDPQSLTEDSELSGIGNWDLLIDDEPACLYILTARRRNGRRFKTMLHGWRFMPAAVKATPVPAEESPKNLPHCAAPAR